MLLKAHPLLNLYYQYVEITNNLFLEHYVLIIIDRDFFKNSVVEIRVLRLMLRMN